MSLFLPVLRIAGAYIAFLLGSGFATGQEIMQFFVSDGLWGVGGCAVFLLVGTWLAVSLLLTGQRHALHNTDEVFRHFAGDRLGPVLGWYTLVANYCVYVVMLSGAGAVLQARLGIPLQAGAVLMAALVIATLLFGLRELVRVIGSIGPVLVGLVLLVACAAIFRDPGASLAGSAAVDSQHMLRAAPNWWLSGLVYTAMPALGLAGFLPPLGAVLVDRRAAVLGGMLGPLLFALALTLCTLALLGGVPQVVGRMVPMMDIAQRAVPALAPLYSWIVLAGIFTTAAPLLWIVAVRFAADGSARYRVLTAALSVLGLVCAMALPFDRLLNLIYPTIGYSGLLLIACIAARQLLTRALA